MYSVYNLSSLFKGLFDIGDNLDSQGSINKHINWDTVYSLEDLQQSEMPGVDQQQTRSILYFSRFNIRRFLLLFCARSCESTLCELRTRSLTLSWPLPAQSESARRICSARFSCSEFKHLHLITKKFRYSNRIMQHRRRTLINYKCPSKVCKFKEKGEILGRIIFLMSTKLCSKCIQMT